MKAKHNRIQKVTTAIEFYELTSAAFDNDEKLNPFLALLLRKKKKALEQQESN